MPPRGKEGAEAGHERERLIEHGVVAGSGHLDHGRGAAEPAEDFVGHVSPDQPIFTPEERRLARQRG